MGKMLSHFFKRDFPSLDVITVPEDRGRQAFDYWSDMTYSQRIAPVDKAYDERALAGSLLVAMTGLWKCFKQVGLPLTTNIANSAMDISRPSHPRPARECDFFFQRGHGKS